MCLTRTLCNVNIEGVGIGPISTINHLFSIASWRMNAIVSKLRAIFSDFNEKIKISSARFYDIYFLSNPRLTQILFACSFSRLFTSHLWNWYLPLSHALCNFRHMRTWHIDTIMSPLSFELWRHTQHIDSNVRRVILIVSRGVTLVIAVVTARCYLATGSQSIVFIK